VYPNYPMTAWRKGTRGTVRLRAQVDTVGVVSQIETMEGDPILALAAERALRRWRYGTQPALAEVVVRFRFVNPEAIFVEFER
jgi:TonB family protein